MSEIETEYQNWLFSERLENFLGKNLDERKKYEAHNIIERWIMSSYELSNEMFVSEIDDVPTLKMIEEIKQKGIAKDDSEATNIVQNILDMIRNFKKRQIIKDGQVKLEKDSLRYKNFKIPITLKIKGLIQNHDIKDVMKMSLRYSATRMGSQHWGLPQTMYDLLYNKYGFRNEAFASPLNSRLIFHKDACYFSLHKDVDSVFKSQGNIFDADMKNYKGYWVFGPPFIENILENSAIKVEKYLNETEGETSIIYFMASWCDSEAYKILDNSKWLRKKYILNKYEHFFTDPNGKIIKASFSTTIFLLGNKVDNIDDAIKMQKLSIPPPKRYFKK